MAADRPRSASSTAHEHLRAVRAAGRKGVVVHRSTSGRATRSARWMIGASALLASAQAHANGRYPMAQFFAVGEGAQRDRIAIVTTFGLVVSVDGGRSWDWICEEAVGYSGQFDPTVTITDDGTLVAGLPDGLSRTAGGDWCEWSRPSSFAAEPVVDLTSAGATVLASVTPPAATQFVSRSIDRGATWTRAWSRAEFYAHTIDLAPSRPSRVYTTGWVRGARPALFRSDDGGDDFIEATRDFAGGYVAYIAWVDPAAHDTLLVRADLDPNGALLLRSDDGGTTFRTLLRSSAALTGVAAAPGARTLWASSSAAGEAIQRSEDEGRTWVPVRSSLKPRSLRFSQGVLYATANEMTAGTSFACSTDGGDTFTPMLVLTQLRGPERCPASSVVRRQCAPSWDSTRAQLAAITRPPAGPSGTCSTEDGGADAAVPLDAAQEDGALHGEDASPLDGLAGLDDAGRSTDSGINQRRVAGGGCACSARSGEAGGASGVGWGWLALRWVRRRRDAPKGR